MNVLSLATVYKKVVVKKFSINISTTFSTSTGQFAGPSLGTYVP